MRPLFVLAGLLASAPLANAQDDAYLVLHPDAVFDGERLHQGWAVVVGGNSIVAAQRDGVHVYYRIIEPKVSHILRCIRTCDM